MPQEDAPPMPPKKLKGMEITKAQGQLMTRKVKARMTHVLQPAGFPRIRLSTEGTTARARAL